MPIVFEDVEAQIMPERAVPAQRDSSAHGSAPEPAQQIDDMRRELDLIAERRARLVAD